LRSDGGGDELTRLKRELERVKEERDIMRKAAAYFAKELG
jgi:transposase